MHKTMFTFTLLMCLLTSVFSQATFPVQWESKFQNDADYWHYTTDDGKFVIGTTKKEVSVLNGADGKPIWNKSFQEIAGVKEAKSQNIIEESEALLFISKQRGNDELFCVDLKTGKVIGLHFGKLKGKNVAISIHALIEVAKKITPSVF